MVISHFSILSLRWNVELQLPPLPSLVRLLWVPYLHQQHQFLQGDSVLPFFRSGDGQVLSFRHKIKTFSYFKNVFNVCNCLSSRIIDCPCLWLKLTGYKSLPWRFLVSDHPKCFFISSQILPMVALWSIRRATWTAVFFSSKFKGSTFVENVPNLRCHPVLSFILIFLDWALSAAFLTNFSYRQSFRVSVIDISFSYPTPWYQLLLSNSSS